MKRFHLPVSILILSLILGLYLYSLSDSPAREVLSAKPDDWFFAQRAFPFADVNHEVYKTALTQALQLKAENETNKISGEWEFAGPVNIGGRVTCIAMNPSDVETFYIGAASGGIFKTQNGGESWNPVFDDQPSLSIGDMAVAPSNPETIYVGTGEANGGGGSVSYEGLGIFKSVDGGDNWEALGLEESGSIGRLVVHPTNPDICYVAAMGRMFSENSQRGVFRTINGGQSWEQVLYLNDSTGAIDISLNPNNPDIVYAALWERVRRPDRRSYGGESCGIYRSTDGGDSWDELTTGLPSGENVGRIGITVAPSNPDILYSIYADKTGYFLGIFKSGDGGSSWQQTNDGALGDMFASYGWWFGRVQVDPVNPDVVYGIGFDLYKTINGGNSWSNISGWDIHVDQHGLDVHPANSNFVVLGNDGGVYISENGGGSFNHVENLPITQFYTCDIDYQNPQRLYGGAQDNGTNRTLTGSLNDWASIYGGDGFYVLVNSDNNQYVYAEYQYGGLGRSTNGGTSFSSATSGINSSDRFNWMSPLVFDPNDPSILYFGSNRIYKSNNNAASWTAISDDLSNGAGQFNQTFGTITTISVSPLNNQVIFTGTDDGNVWFTLTGGSFWSKISDDLPERWVTRVAADPFDVQAAYVTFSGYRNDEFLSHIFRTSNFGDSWDDISGDLPEVPINDVIVDPTLEGALYIATDAGVFVSWNDGENWGMLGSQIPVIPVCDIRLHDDLRMLVAATYGRSMYKIYLDDFVKIREPVTEKMQLKVFPNPATKYFKVSNPYSDETVKYLVMDMMCKVVLSGEESINTRWVELRIEELPSGNYTLMLKGKNENMTGKFVKK